MSLLFYRRPDFVKRYDGPLDAMACQRMVAKNYSNKQSLPESVSFDKIIENRTHPVSLPCLFGSTALTIHSHVVYPTS